MPDAGELAERFRYGRRQFPHQVADARVDFLAAPAALEVAADDLVQRVVSQRDFLRQTQTLRQFRGQQTLERNFTTGPIGHAEQFGPDDGNHLFLFDELENVVPKKFLERWDRGKHGMNCYLEAPVESS